MNRIFPRRSFKLIEPLENYNLGLETKQEREMVSYHRKNIDPVYSNWSINEILNWKNDWLPQNIFHIHGNKDRIFPIKKIRADHIINTGGHLMIMNRSYEVQKCISTILKN